MYHVVGSWQFHLLRRTKMLVLNLPVTVQTFSLVSR